MNNSNLPNHVVIIPDGNRRWARKRGLKPWEGHESGAKIIEKLVRQAFNLGIKNLSFWGSSLENFRKRSLRERKALLGIYSKYFRKLIKNDDIYKNKTKINVIGRWNKQFPKSLVKIIQEGIKKTRHYQNYTLNFFLAYSGDDEMTEAVKKIIAKCLKGHVIKRHITGKTIKENLMTKNLPKVDYLIRTGGEPHLSAGFLMWDIANAQLYFSEKYFPDFGTGEFKKAIEEYQKRERRLGR